MKVTHCFGCPYCKDSNPAMQEFILDHNVAKQLIRRDKEFSRWLFTLLGIICSLGVMLVFLKRREVEEIAATRIAITRKQLIMCNKCIRPYLYIPE